MFEINLITIQVLIDLFFYQNLNKFLILSIYLTIQITNEKFITKKFLALEVFLYFLILLSYCPATSFLKIP